jgi:hypothetical protein
MFTASNPRVRWAIVAALAMCVLGVLILPQVDLPDFVIKSAGSHLLGPDRIVVEAFACGQAVISVFLDHRSPLYGLNVLLLTSILARTNFSLEQKQIFALRC